MMKGRRVYILVALMLVILGLQSVLSMRQESAVCDEVSHHIATGYSFLMTRDFRLNSTSPPLTQILAALPLLALRPVFPIDDPSWNNIDRVTFGFRFLYRYNDNAEQLVFWARVPMVALSLLCALLVFIFARDLYGANAGLFAMFLYTFSPNILAYSKIVTPDIGVTFFGLLAIYRLYKYLKKPKLGNILFAGLALGLAQACKLSALLLIPLVFIVVIWKVISAKRPVYLLHMSAIFLICAVVLFGSYLGEVKPFLKNDIDVQEKIGYLETAVDKLSPGDNTRIKEKAIDLALHAPIPFATYLMNILAEANMVFVKDYGVFLMGKRSASGWWYYYPLVFLFKTPIPMLLFLLLSGICFFRIKPSNRWGEMTGVIFLAGFILASLLTKLQLSVRYILPLYPLFFIYVSKIVNLKVKREMLLRSTLIALSIWYMLESVIIHPHYISYFNQLAGGPDNGWRYLRDANIDYGQDLPALARYIKTHDIDKIKLAYFGSADPAYYGIIYSDLDQTDLRRPGEQVYAISANYIDRAEWMKEIRPTAKAGYSIFIYDLREGQRA